jgi:hypothetical protein
MPAFSSELLESLLEDFEYLIDLPRISLTVARWQCLCIYDSQTDRQTDRQTHIRHRAAIAVLAMVCLCSLRGIPIKSSLHANCGAKV